MRKIIKDFITKLDNGFALLVNLTNPKNVEPIIFIIGPPRSGTTLVYQLLCHSLGLPCLTNYDVKRPYMTVFRAAFSSLFSKPSQSNRAYSSIYGKTEGNYGPNEAGQFWYRWFKAEFSGEKNDNWRNANSKASLINGVTAVAKLKGGRVVFKNVYHSMRLDELNSTFPDSLYVVVNRPTIDIAQSILNARDNCPNGRKRWWSVPVGSVDTLEKLSWSDQIIKQVEVVYERITKFQRKNLESRFFNVDYDGLCESPLKVIKELEAFLIKNGIQVNWSEPKISEIEPSSGVTVEHSDYKLLVRSLEEYPKQN